MNNGAQKYYNSFSVYDNELNLLNAYNKINLVPFGEFLPFEKTFSSYGLKKITRGYNSFSVGDKRETINLGENFNNKLILQGLTIEKSNNIVNKKINKYVNKIIKYIKKKNVRKEDINKI